MSEGTGLREDERAWERELQRTAIEPSDLPARLFARLREAHQEAHQARAALREAAAWCAMQADDTVTGSVEEAALVRVAIHVERMAQEADGPPAA